MGGGGRRLARELARPRDWESLAQEFRRRVASRFEPEEEVSALIRDYLGFFCGCAGVLEAAAERLRRGHAPPWLGALAGCLLGGGAGSREVDSCVSAIRQRAQPGDVEAIAELLAHRLGPAFAAEAEALTPADKLSLVCEALQLCAHIASAGSIVAGDREAGRVAGSSVSTPCLVQLRVTHLYVQLLAARFVLRDATRLEEVERELEGVVAGWPRDCARILGAVGDVKAWFFTDNEVTSSFAASLQVVVELQRELATPPPDVTRLEALLKHLRQHEASRPDNAFTVPIRLAESLLASHIKCGDRAATEALLQAVLQTDVCLFLNCVAPHLSSVAFAFPALCPLAQRKLALRSGEDRATATKCLSQKADLRHVARTGDYAACLLVLSVLYRHSEAALGLFVAELAKERFALFTDDQCLEFILLASKHRTIAAGFDFWAATTAAVETRFASRDFERSFIRAFLVHAETRGPAADEREDFCRRFLRLRSWRFDHHMKSLVWPVKSRVLWEEFAKRSLDYELT